MLILQTLQGVVKPPAWVGCSANHPSDIHTEEAQLLTYLPADEGNFMLTMRAYEPPFVRCQDTVPASQPFSKACATVLNNMNASTEQTTFGARGVADVQEYLPQLLTDCKHHFPKSRSRWWLSVIPSNWRMQHRH